MRETNGLSICMIVKNEAETLEKVIQSAPYQQLVIGVDETSNDGTYDIAGRYADSLFTFHWEDDFAKVRNMTLVRATGDWVLWLDGHEFVAPQSYEFFNLLNTLDKRVGILSVKLEMYPDDVMEGGRPEHYFYSNKLFRNGLGIKFSYPIHAMPTGLPEGYENSYVDELILEHRRSAKLSTARAEQRVAINAKKFKEVLEKDPKDLRAMFYLIQSCVEIGDWVEGEKWCLRHLELSDWAEERYQVKYFLAHIYIVTERFGKAREVLIDAHKEDWQRNECYLLLGDLCMEQGNLTEAVHWYKIASVVEKPISPMFVWSRGCEEVPWMRLTTVYGKMGELGKARECALKVAQWHPDESARVVSQIDEKLRIRERENVYGQN